MHTINTEYRFELNLSVNYFGGLIQKETRKSAQEYKALCHLPAFNAPFFVTFSATLFLMLFERVLGLLLLTLIYMEVTIDVRYEQLLAAIKRLPAEKINQLKSVLDEGFINEKATEELSDFQNYLLKAPVMHTNQFEKHRSDRKHFSQWRTK